MQGEQSTCPISYFVLLGAWSAVATAPGPVHFGSHSFVQTPYSIIGEARQHLRWHSSATSDTPPACPARSATYLAISDGASFMRARQPPELGKKGRRQRAWLGEGAQPSPEAQTGGPKPSAFSTARSKELAGPLTLMQNIGC